MSQVVDKVENFAPKGHGDEGTRSTLRRVAQEVGSTQIHRLEDKTVRRGAEVGEVRARVLGTSEVYGIERG